MMATNALTLVYVGALPPHPGGGAISCFQILAGLARLGHRVRALVPMTPEALAAPAPDLRRHGIEVTPVTVPYFGVQAFVPDTDEYREGERRQVHEQLPKLIAAERPDVLLSRERQSVTVGMAKLARDHGLPWVLLSRGYPLVAILNGAYPEAMAARALAEYAEASLVITPARHMSEGLRRLGISAAITIPNAIDLAEFAPRKKSPALLERLSIGDRDVVVVHAANLHRRKRPMDVIESAAHATRRDRALRYVVIGDGALRGDLETACHRLELGDVVRFVGWVDYASMPDYINLADIVVMPSESEGLARVYLEAQACARVLIASDIPPAREVVTDGETGLLFPPGDVAALTEQTVRAAGDPVLRERIGRHAHARVQVNSLGDAGAAYSNALEGVVRGHSA
jgi:glycosyltransferase involved in cell wall biosynthesis